MASCKEDSNPSPWVLPSSSITENRLFDSYLIADDGVLLCRICRLHFCAFQPFFISKHSRHPEVVQGTTNVQAISFPLKICPPLKLVICFLGSCSSIDMCYCSWIKIGCYTGENKWISGPSTGSLLCRFVWFMLGIAVIVAVIVAIIFWRNVETRNCRFCLTKKN